MGRRLVFDIETDGLLPDLTKVHSLCIKDIDTGEAWSCARDSDYTDIEVGLALLEQADLIAGHNIIAFDIPALKKVYPTWSPRGVVRDTIVMARLIWPKDYLKDRDMRLVNSGRLPKQHLASFKLEAFGYRLGNYKGDFKGPWGQWSREMQDYCEQDVEVTLSLWKKIEAQQWDEKSIQLEHDVAEIIERQVRHGFYFDQKRASELYATLVSRRQELLAELQRVFPPWEVRTTFVPKVNNKKLGYVKGQPVVKVKTVTFNPASRDHIAQRLKAQRGWKPEQFTPDGRPKVDEEVLSALPYEEAKVLSEYLMVEKRIGQLATGKEAWLKRVSSDGRIHGRVVTNGAVTGRMTHSGPNVAQVPSSGAPYGHECRSLFRASPGKVLVGCDADALELRCLAGYMARYDGGAYVSTVLEGKKEEGTDMHTLNAKALGCSRDTAKVWFYAFIYGAGDEKLGTILGFPAGSRAKKAGKESRKRFLAALPALGKIVDKVKQKVRKVGKLRGLDGRVLYCRSEHSAFNTLLQSAGAVMMKQGLVILDKSLQDRGFVPGDDYEFVANVHDEWQIECKPEIAQQVGELAVQAIVRAGEVLGFKCPLNGQYQIGPSWAETH